MRIAIVGLGTAGTCMLDSLWRVFRNRTDVHLTLYDPTDSPWQGRVFQDDGDWVVANVPAEAMSIRDGDPDHAKRWLVEQGRFDPDSSVEAFLPRALYGRYISTHATRLIEDLKGIGWQIEFVKAKATTLVRNDISGYTVGSDGRRDEHDHVVLCAGGSVLADPFDLTSQEGYIGDPYPTRERFSDIPTSATVGIVGSGLTAIDAVVSLQALGHAGPVRLYSRSGVLPFVRRPGPRWAARHLTRDGISALSGSDGQLRLADVEHLFDREVEAWGGEPRGILPPLPISDPRTWIRRQLEHPHDHRDLGTFIFQKSIPSIWGDIWYSLDAESKRRLSDSRTLRDIMSRCCPMPRVNAEKILAMLDTGQLQVRANVQAISPARKGFTVHLASDTDEVDYIVNAVTPGNYGVHPNVRTLVESASSQKLVARHDFGGIEVTGHSRVAHDVQDHGSVHALGDLTRGAFFFIFGLPVLVSRSATIADAIRARELSAPASSASRAHTNEELLSPTSDAAQHFL